MVDAMIPADAMIVVPAMSGGETGDTLIADGFARIWRAAPVGMVTLRGDLGSAGMARAVRGMGLSVPDLRRVSHADTAGGIEGVAGGTRMLAWMSPDEALLITSPTDLAADLATLTDVLAGEHALVCDVSDARALFRISGALADQVLMKLCPVDFARLAPDEMRRTRAAQVACAVWRSGPETLSLVCFRSVAGYIAKVLETAALPGSALFSE